MAVVDDEAFVVGGAAPAAGSHMFAEVVHGHDVVSDHLPRHLAGLDLRMSSCSLDLSLASRLQENATPGERIPLRAAWTGIRQ